MSHAKTWLASLVALASACSSSDEQTPSEPEPPAAETEAPATSEAAPAAPITDDAAYCRLFAERMNECMPVREPHGGVRGRALSRRAPNGPRHRPVERRRARRAGPLPSPRHLRRRGRLHARRRRAPLTDERSGGGANGRGTRARPRRRDDARLRRVAADGPIDPSADRRVFAARGSRWPNHGGGRSAPDGACPAALADDHGTLGGAQRDGDAGS